MCHIDFIVGLCKIKPGQEATSAAVIGGAGSMTSIVVADTYASFQRYSNIRVTSVSTLVYKRFT